MIEYSEIINVINNEWKLLLFLSIIILLYWHYTRTFKFFEKKKVKFLKPKFLIGNLGPRLLLKTSFHKFNQDIYNALKGYPFAGLFEGQRPVLMVLDPNLIKAILIRDFDHFTDRNVLGSKEPPYIKRSLLNLKGHDWKSVRSILTPTFSSARLRSMMPLVHHCSFQLVDLLKQHDNTDVEMKYFFGHFTLEVIGACAFGIKCDVLCNKNSNFLKVAEKFNYMPTWKRMIFFFFIMLMPQVLKYTSFSFFNPESTSELMKILNANKKERRSGREIKTSDFLQLMIEASDKEKTEAIETEAKTNLDDDTIDAQSLLFLIAGYETSSTLLSFAVHVMATRPDLQDKLRSHINDVANGREITYEVLSEMTYLDCFLTETLRLYPPVPRLDRVCTKKYTLPGSTVTLDVGDIVMIPVYGIHMDPDIYEEPEVFQPERFTDEGKKDRAAHMFLGFGAGPRNCIGLRFAIITAKLAIISLLRNFEFTKCDQTVDPVQFDKKSFLLKPESGLWVHVTSINVTT